MSNHQQPAAELGPFLDHLLDQLAERVADRLRPTDSQGSDGAKASPWMSITSAAAYLDWPKQRLYKLSASGEIPHYKHEGRLLFRRDELDAWLSTYTQGDHTT
jgi:excisionase family DNA binding protein